MGEELDWEGTRIEYINPWIFDPYWKGLEWEYLDINICDSIGIWSKR